MESGFAARNGGLAGVAVLVAIVLLGAGLRLDYAWSGRPPVFDAEAYAEIAADLDEGQGFTAGPEATQPSSNYSPGLPLAVAAIYEASGGVHERLARLVLALFCSLVVPFTYLIGRRLGRALRPGSGTDVEPPAGHLDAGVAAGLIGALAVAVYPAFLEYQGMLMSEPLAATLLAASALALFWARDGATGQGDPASGSCRGEGGLRAGEGVRSRPPSPRHPLVRWVLPGLLLGALAMVRPEYLGVAAVLVLVVFGSEARRTQWRSALLRAGVLLAGIVVVVAPWTVRNEVALHRFVPLSTGSGQVLFAGTYLPSGGNPEEVGAKVVAENPALFAPGAVQNLRLEQILARLAAHTYPELESDQALSRMGREQLWEDVSEEPLEYLGFLAKKVGRIWSHGPRQVMRRPVWEALHWALLGLGLLGLAVLAWRRRWEALAIGAVFGSITAISALLVASPRRVLVMLPLLAALAGCGAVWLWGELQRRRRAAGDPVAPSSLSRP